MPLSAAIAGLFAAVVGAPLLRLKGHYFAVATLGVAEGLRELVINLPRLTGGGGGISIPAVGNQAPTRWLGNDGFYVLFLVIAVAVVAMAIFVSTSRGGYALRAIHQDEDAAAAMGINTTVAKTIVFGVSAALTGAVGAAGVPFRPALARGPYSIPGLRTRREGTPPNVIHRHCSAHLARGPIGPAPRRCWRLARAATRPGRWHRCAPRRPAACGSPSPVSS
jgi:Branched-chain amino acid transport system / permease component